MTTAEIVQALKEWSAGETLTVVEQAALDIITVRLAPPPRPCQGPGCQKTLPPTARPHAKTCSSACRMALSRARRRTQGGQGGQTSSTPLTSSPPPHSNPVTPLKGVRPH